MRPYLATSGVASLALLVSAAAPQPLARPSGAARDQALVMLDQMREDLERHYYDETFRGVDLEASSAKARTAIARASSTDDLYAALSDWAMQLDDSHTSFLPPDRGVHPDYGWRLSMVGDLPLVASVTPGSDAAAGGLAPGDEVLELDGVRPSRANLWKLEHLYHVIRPRPHQHLLVRTPGGAERALDVAAAFPDPRRDTARERPSRLRRIAPGILVWQLPGFGRTKPIEDAIAQARSASALVLDLRGDGGGTIAALRALISRLFDREITIGTLRARTAREALRAAPVPDPFTGRVIVIVDSESASSAEMLARVVQIEHRGTVVGDRTAGAVMMGRIYLHPLDAAGRTMFGVMVTVADVRMKDGRSLEHVGVAPDVRLVPRPADLAAGRDAVLARAVAMAGGALTPEEAGRLFR